MNKIIRCIVASGAALGLAAAVAGCGGEAAAPTGPVTIEYWGSLDGQQAVADAFNKSHTDIQVKYTKIAGAAEALNVIRNAFKADSAPCLVQNQIENLTSLLSEGITKDITEWIEPHKEAYNPAVYAAATIEGRVYGVPTAASPAFTAYRTDVFAANGVPVPTTWEELVEAGRTLAAKGIKITNIAGEDASLLVTTAWQAGAKWYSVEGDSWKVAIDSPESRKAGAIVQQIIDGDMFSSISFADYAAVMRSYDTGTTVTRHISTWQLAGMEKNFRESTGKWALAPWPSFTGSAPAIPGGSNNSGGLTLVTEQCEHPEQAVEAANWFSTDPSAVKTMASTSGGAGLFPAVADPSPYVEAMLPTNVLGAHRADAPKIILDSLPTTVTGWVYGPNWTAVGAELADGWAKVLTKTQTVNQLLAHLQEWTVNDLKSRGISVVS